mmetsp:Transcript_52346/g.157110  ORF Transcript_52346/g.157110 Transcript_52346/m.157110 type:complete len:98 (-) Transcript_52346:2150-2443(-)
MGFAQSLNSLVDTLQKNPVLGQPQINDLLSIACGCEVQIVRPDVRTADLRLLHIANIFSLGPEMMEERRNGEFSLHWACARGQEVLAQGKGGKRLLR